MPLVKTKLYAARIKFAQVDKEAERLRELGIEPNNDEEQNDEVTEYLTEGYIQTDKIITIFKQSDNNDWLVSLSEGVDLKIPSSSVKDLIGQV